MLTANPNVPPPTPPTTVGDIFTAWIKALRSGEYPQGVRYLCCPTPSGTKFCCLGVLCEVLGKKTTPTNRMDGSTYMCSYLWPDGYHTSGLGSDFWESLVGPKGPEQNLLWQWNDSDHKTFPQIADYLEELMANLPPEHLATTPVGLLAHTPMSEEENASNLGGGASEPTA